MKYVQEDVNKNNYPRYKAYYQYSKKKVLVIVMDFDTSGFLTVVTYFIMDSKKQLEAIRNARKYAKIANRL